MRESTERQTQAVFDHHWQAYLAKDLDAILSDYVEESVVIVNLGSEPLKGLVAIRGLYAQVMELLTPEVLGQLKITHQVVDGEIAYIAFSAGTLSPLITDTFVIRGGKIAAQTSAALMGRGS